LTELGVSFDSWWVNEDFSVKLNQIGFDKQVICAKKNLVLETQQERQSLAAYRGQVELLPGWGQERPLLGPQAQTLAQLKHWLHRKGSFSQLLQEHFHPIGWGLS